MRKIVWTIVILMILGLSFFMYEKETGKEPLATFTNISKADSMEEVAKAINMALKDGSDSNVTIKVSSKISEDELKRINYYIDTVQGNVKSLSTFSTAGRYRRVTFDTVRADSMYVYDAIVSGKEIPAEKETAKELYRKVESVLSNTVSASMSDYDKELALHDYLVNHCVYGESSDGDESEFTAYGALVNERAVCSGYAAAFHLLLSCEGIPVNFMVGEASSTDQNGVSSTQNHAWCQVQVSGVWYEVDPTWDDPVGEGQILSHQYFNVSDQILERNHSWEKKTGEKCSSMEANYFYRNGLYFSDYNNLTRQVGQELSAGNTVVEVAVNGLNMGENQLQGIFENTNVSHIMYSITGQDDYQILRVSTQ